MTASSALRPPEELLPCPFCGGRADWDSKPGAIGEQFWCMCVNDECSFYAAEPLRNTSARKTEAIAAWNRRAPTIGLDDSALVERGVAAIGLLSRQVTNVDKLSPYACAEIVKAVLTAITKGTP